MSGLRWLRLNRTGLEMVPYEVSKLTKLVSNVTGPISLKHNSSFREEGAFRQRNNELKKILYILISNILLIIKIYLQEHLSLVRNNLRDLHSDVGNLPNLRVVNCRYNKLKNSGIPANLFKLDDLSVLVSNFL